jgi:prepilin-type N-terminal cleavage/methylation domain-containing protein
MIYLKHMHHRGFTLVETLVSLAIFSFVMVIAGGITLSIISSNRQNQAINNVVNNLNYSIESMVRDIKTGYSYKCNYNVQGSGAVEIDEFKSVGSGCVAGVAQNNISLISTITGTEMIVRYDFVVGNPGYIKKTAFSGTDGLTMNQYPLTDKVNIDIQQLVFKVDPGIPLYAGTTVNTNTDSTGPSQPSVFVLLKGTARVNAINISDFFMQTLVSQRLPNLI